PSARTTRREPSKAPRHLAAPHQSRTAAAALFLAVATKVLQSTGPARCDGATQVSRFPSSTHAASVHPSRCYRRPSASNPTNAGFLAGTQSGGREGQNADRHV